MIRQNAEPDTFGVGGILDVDWGSGLVRLLLFKYSLRSSVYTLRRRTLTRQAVTLLKEDISVSEVAGWFRLTP